MDDRLGPTLTSIGPRKVRVHSRRVLTVAGVVLAASAVVVAVMLAAYLLRGQWVTVAFEDGRRMYTEFRTGDWYPFGAGSLGEVPLVHGVYRDATGAVVSRVVNGTGIRVVYYPDGTVRSIAFYSGRRVRGPSLTFSQSGLVTAGGSFDATQNPHGPFVGYHDDGQLRYLHWYRHGVPIPALGDDSCGDAGFKGQSDSLRSVHSEQLHGLRGQD